eukprot:CAMPEP_0202904088 /NCGR_PEP_ID=MMETSP1392-20130828/27835_1 /ASSEMBLY_ACC=CAM_ASM_000868 /TAXON_ID=225041 /ORGANISM="Chlamydomonas chlamydogama, Strain SAG 11-48b" /LENGTH=846 /DNA_ID=CAMNT_0049591569 /DNA_START=246 /DNA_END=2786 /DNA_ORIENTATION=+
MISCANLSADDLVLKKMLYLYITHYATQIPDLALLAINQLHKDCRDQDPMVRGLALRSLCSLRVANFLEYVTAPVNTGLEDRHPYVRRTAVMGVLKIYNIDASVVLAQGMFDKVRHMLRADNDPQVIANGLTVLMQVEDVKRLSGDKGLLYSLVNRIKEFSDWSQCQVLEVVSHHVPANDSEVYEFLNALEDRMGHTNSAVVMATIKAFLHLTLSMPATHQQVLERIKDPLKTLISREDPATTYAVLSHVLLLVQRAPIIFEQDYVAFYCRTHDPPYVKKLKMEVLAAIATPQNVYEIVNELTEYARDISPAMAREAVRAVGRIALTVPDVSGLIERLLLFLEAGSEHLTSEALVQMKDLLRRYPDMAEACIPQINELVPAHIEEPEARAALLWIIGQFGQHIPDAPYTLETLVEGFGGEEACVRLALLTAATQLFFKRPPECQKLLGALLSAAINDNNQDVHDRALLYYRLLRANVAEAERIINPPLLEVKNFSESLTADMKDTIFQEFNTLSVVFSAPSSTFVERRAYHVEEEEEELRRGSETAAYGQQGPAPDLLGGVDNATNLLGDEDKVESDLLDLDIAGNSTGTSTSAAAAAMHLPLPGGGALAINVPAAAAPRPPGGAFDLDGLLGDLMGPPAPAPAPQPATANVQGGLGSSGIGGLAGLSGLGAAPSSHVHAAVPQAAGGGGGMLMDLGDMLGGLGMPSSAAPSHPPTSSSAPELRLNSQARISSAVFQDNWKSLPAVHQYTERLSPATIAAMSANSHKDFCQHMTQAYIMTMASGGQPPTFKYYFYSQVADSGALVLVEVVVRTDACSASITFKSEAVEAMPQFMELWTNCLAGFMR